MKKFILIVLSSFFLSFALIGCQQQTEDKRPQESLKETQALDVRESVWNQLTADRKKHIKGSWKEASVQKIILRETMGKITDKALIGKEVYIVDYPSNDNPTLGGVTVYADIKSHQIIGYGYRE